MAQPKAKEYEVGERVGDRTVLAVTTKRVGSVQSSRLAYLVQCSCGREDVVIGHTLRAGLADRCVRCAYWRGVMLSPSRSAKLFSVGDRVGERTVVERVFRPGPRGVRLVDYRMRCDCGRESIVPGVELRAGRATRCRSCAARTKRAVNSGGVS